MREDGTSSGSGQAHARCDMPPRRINKKARDSTVYLALSNAMVFSAEQDQSPNVYGTTAPGRGRWTW
jgi:hypothetical protein